MATSIKDIYNKIIIAKDQMALTDDTLEGLGHANDDATKLVADLNSTSKVAIWRLWAYITAVVIFFHEKLWDLFKAEVEDKLKAIPGTDIWLARECKKFQYHDTEPQNLVFQEDGSYAYDEVVADNQIIKRVAVSSEFGATVVKVATQLTEGGVLQKLSGDQLNSFEGFLRLIQYAGSSVSVASEDSDKMRVHLEIYHNALTPLPELKTRVEEAITNYLSNLQFDGAFKVIKLIDGIQALDSITDVSVTKIEAKSTQASGFTDVSRVYHPASGYIEIDEPVDQNEYDFSEALKYSVE